jgi:hypothetical protein
MDFPRHASALWAAAISLAVVWACSSWQSTRTSPAPALTAEFPTGGLDAGTPSSAPSEPPRLPGLHSEPIATAQLTAGMLANDPAPVAPVPRCPSPIVQVAATEPCASGAPYPDCRWRLPEPDAAGHAHERWRNTRPEHWWGRPALVSTILSIAHGYADRFPGERIVVGDLDAPGPRHSTHDRGVDVDLYLPGIMESDNTGSGSYPSNYVSRPHLTNRLRRARVQHLARLLASCTGGAVRIYYNDPPVSAQFTPWFQAHGFVSPFGRAMQAHNALHRFHFHVTIDEGLPPTEGVSPVYDAAPSLRRP